MKLEIHTQPQQIWANPLTKDQALVNHGPSMIYLGEDGSTSPDSGIPLAPLGSIVWEAGKTLWACTASGIARLFIVNNGNAPLAPQAQATHVIYQELNVAANGGITPMIDATAWNALLISATRRNPTVVDNMDIRILWYDDEGNSIVWEEWIQSFSWDKLYHEVPVRGSQFQLDNETTKAIDLTVQGTTRNLFGQSTSPDEFDNICDLWPGGGGSIGLLKVYRGVITVTDFLSNNNFPLGGLSDTMLFIPSWSDVINVGVHVNGNITVAGRIVVWDLEQGSDLPYDSLVVPIANANSFTSGSLHIPRHRAVALGGLPPMGGAGPVARAMDITLMYQGYDSPGA